MAALCVPGDRVCQLSVDSSLRQFVKIRCERPFY
ncbi:hypothetical protein BP1258A_5159 [Burkholderia pseudomallei 1258a]|uniref:Uncharacterized protein n=1 Tax=Burkholderia pseudomallei (strain 1026b) TaxID=884204 RepID=A0A0H3HT77_BURP2|nr:hypothetical protein BP1026B_I2912 [Burkholderia pseudomallei 1026b]EIF52387.1 hypothetical protein BP1258B_6059 [Burkholderia pseudomallei 1258b]EIF54247.1 hypothetical protein BP1258A_5159 [Burkholderia pseudomallei 1258a]EIF56098.1 hypothetical protein BP1026A_4388 [Burkholderia pseudomallei 1026a]EIF69489.1 hypothetical protein BP354E_5659 [Burkholderia pseudomallei 354e]EIF80141.1 hypothetical protein BP354A_2657 [Burkholderia pseudomallei 354a]